MVRAPKFWVSKMLQKHLMADLCRESGRYVFEKGASALCAENPRSKSSRLWTKPDGQNKLGTFGESQFAISSQIRQFNRYTFDWSSGGCGSVSTLSAVMARSHSSFIRLGRCTQLAMRIGCEGSAGIPSGQESLP